MKSDDQVQMLQEKMEATTRQWETDKVNWTRKQEQSNGETKMLKDTLSQKELVCTRNVYRKGTLLCYVLAYLFDILTVEH